MTGCDKWLTLFLFLLFGSMVAIAFQYPPEARFAPLVIGLPGIALCLVQLAFDLGYRRDALASAAPKLGRPENFVEDPTEFTPGTLHREFAAWGYFLSFVAALLAFGFHVAVPALLFVYLWRETRLGWMFALSIGVGSLLVMIFIVSGALHLPLFAGFVVPALLRLPGG
jgi:hypothetical protein